MVRRFLCLVLLLLPLASCAPRAAPTRPAPPAATRATPADTRESILEGLASWYGPGFVGRRTANGEIFTSAELTAAHKTLPFNTRVRVTRLDNSRSVVVRINDRGPFKPGRVIDLSRVAALELDLIRSGVARVRLEVLDGVAGAGVEGAGLEGAASVSPAPWRAAAWSTLTGYDVVSRYHGTGDLLFLTSPEVTEPILVRVIASEFPARTNADVLLSPEAFALLGAAVSEVP